MNLQELILYSQLSNDDIIKKYISFIEAENYEDGRENYFELIKLLILEGMSIENYLFNQMIKIENPFLEKLCHEEYEPNNLDRACLKNDLSIIKIIINADIVTNIMDVDDNNQIYTHIEDNNVKSLSAKAYGEYFKESITFNNEDINQFINVLRTYGIGTFANNNVFYIDQNEQLMPISNFSPLPWDQIYDYDLQKKALLDNTKALVEGRPYHHVLLEGASGTGKSSSVKAVVDLFKGEKLRLIQLYKSQLKHLPYLLERLNGSIFKFIIFIDDLSFEVNDDDYKLLKSYIEGGILNESTNIAFYVTSNRQHLIKEIRSDREGDIHLEDSIQETTSLSARFGLHLSFLKPVQKEYFSMIVKMLEKENIEFNQEEMEIEARRWALKHRGMSGRIAMQFVKHTIMHKR